jgi:eukaryotic-like serine/threonine-protein kinase
VQPADETRPRPQQIQRTQIQHTQVQPTQVQGQQVKSQQDNRTRRFEPATYPLATGDPQVLGNYRLAGRLLSPEVASDLSRPVVFLAEDPQGTHVVVKAARLDAGWEALERLRREARNASRVQGPQVAAILAPPAEDLGYLYIVQQYVHGTPLDQLLITKPAGALAAQDALRLALGLLAGIRAIHQAGVTHRDIKPGNIIVSLDGPVIVDFGNSHHQDDDRITTQGGQRWGTPKYMSPEQFDELGVSSAIDLFGFAVTMVEAAAGHHPYAEPGRSVAYQQINGKIPPNVSGVPPELIPVIRTALEPDARRRSTAGYLERRLSRSDQVERAQGQVDVPLPDPEKRRLDLPDVGAGLAAVRLRAEDALADGHRWFLIACVVALFASVPAGIVLRVVMGLIL